MHSKWWIWKSFLKSEKFEPFPKMRTVLILPFINPLSLWIWMDSEMWFLLAQKGNAAIQLRPIWVHRSFSASVQFWALDPIKPLIGPFRYEVGAQFWKSPKKKSSKSFIKSGRQRESRATLPAPTALSAHLPLASLIYAEIASSKFDCVGEMRQRLADYSGTSQDVRWLAHTSREDECPKRMIHQNDSVSNRQRWFEFERSLLRPPISIIALLLFGPQPCKNKLVGGLEICGECIKIRSRCSRNAEDVDGSPTFSAKEFVHCRCSWTKSSFVPRIPAA